MTILAPPPIAAAMADPRPDPTSPPARPRRDPPGAGGPAAVSILGGVVIGSLLGQPTIGALTGITLAAAIAIGLWIAYR